MQFGELPQDPAVLEALVRRRLVYDARAELQIASVMYQRKTRPPFVGQLDHDAEMARLREQLVALRAAARAVTWPDREQALLSALAARPDDGVLVQRLGEHYGRVGRSIGPSRWWNLACARPRGTATCGTLGSTR